MDARAFPPSPPSPPSDHDRAAHDLDEARAWTAVVERDRRADGRFVFAVLSTGIYCRPSCPARRPRRDRVRFYVDGAHASREGFRACKRCLPDGASREDRLVDEVRARLDASLDAPPTLAELADAVALSPSHLQRTFTRAFGCSPRDYVRARRAERMKTSLREGASVTSATYEAGYSASSRAYADARELLAMTPAAYRRGGAGETIRYAIVESAMGRALVACTERGVVRVDLGDDDEALVSALRDELPRATIVRDDEAFPERVADVRALLAGDAAGDAREVELDPRGTPFQLRVWSALRAIPRGATTTYAELAHDLGLPNGARAVARACATNAIAVAVPCHRVVRGDGALAGYRWGLDKKEALLRRERR
jgi:AraC family transcriptional regulator of adaptative response/methylated-DNA-[protein]-cysteine methyltransferase